VTSCSFVDGYQSFRRTFCGSSCTSQKKCAGAACRPKYNVTSQTTAKCVEDCRNVVSCTMWANSGWDSYSAAPLDRSPVPNERPCMPDVINRIARRVEQEWQRLHFDVKAIHSFPDVTPLALPYKDAWTRMYSPPSHFSSISTLTRQLKYPSFARDFIKINRRDRITYLIVK